MFVAATASGQFGSPSVTVTGVNNDDMVVESTWGDNSFGTIGADQTERNSQLPSSLLKQSTQPGTAGGVMSWSSASSNWGIGAVAFKPVAAGGAKGPLVSIQILKGLVGGALVN